MTVEQILNAFQQEIERDAKTYLEEARRVAEYDAILRDSQRDISLLSEQVSRCLIEQTEVEQTLTQIGAFQSELDRTLTTVERNVDDLFSGSSSSNAADAAHLMPVDADVEREAAYKMARDVDVRLQELHSSLQTTLRRMDAAQERSAKDDNGTGAGVVGQIVHVLNQHQSSLATLHDMGRRMEHDIALLNQAMAQR